MIRELKYSIIQNTQLNSNMAFNPFNMFKGNPKVLELMNTNSQIGLLLLQEPFVSQFKRTQNEALQTYMNYEKYTQLIDYITMINHSDSQNKNKSFKYPFVSAQILSINNQLTYKYLLEQCVFIEEEIEEEIQVQKQIDSQSSERSYSSIKSNSSSTSKKDKIQTKTFEQENKENFILKDSNDISLTQYNFKEDKQICQDDFPDVKIRKSIIVKQLTKRIIKRPLQPLIFKIISYFQNSSVTHILDGYVCKVLQSVLNNKFESLIKILKKYNKFAYLKAIFSHIESNSVQELLLNFISKLIDLDNSNPISDEATLIDYIQDHCLERQEEWTQHQCLSLEDRVYYLNLYGLVIQKLTSKIKIKHDILLKQQNSHQSFQKQLLISTTIINNKHIEEISSILGQVIDNYSKHIQYVKIAYNYLKILKNTLNCYIELKNLKKNSKISKQQQIQIEQIIKSCEDAFDRLINMGISYIFQQFLYFDGSDIKKYRPKHSLCAKIQFLDIIGKLIHQNIYYSKRTLIDNPLYGHILKLLDVYPSSSIFHNGIIKLIAPFISKQNDTAILNKFFSKQNLFSYIHCIVKEDIENRYQKKQKNRKCFIGQIALLCLLLQKLNFQQSQQLINYKAGQQWQYIHECLIQEQKGIKNKVLGGFQKLVQKKPIIFFNKNECLNHFKNFLTGVKFNLFDQFQNYEPSNSDSEDQKNQQKTYIQQDTKIDSNCTQNIEETMAQDSKYFDQNIPI